MSQRSTQRSEHSTAGAYVHPGEEFTRDTAYIEDRIVRDPARADVPEGAQAWPVEAGRYQLVAARACPWANRTLIVRRLLGLEDALPVGLPGPVHDVRSWTFDLDADGRDPVLGIERLQEAYFARYPDYPRGITVPAVVEIASGQVVTNDFPRITEDLAKEWGAFHREGAPDLWPAELEEEMREVMQRVYTEVNNGVYRCGFAGSQRAHEKAYERLWAAMDWLEDRLATRRYLMGQHITEADVRLFTTLVRFDPVYHSHFKCSRNKLTEMPHLWGYARDLFQTPGFGDTVDFEQIKQHYFVVHEDINPSQIVPVGPDLDNWVSAHGREALGGSPFAAGTAPGPVRPEERVDGRHTPLTV
jgi:glutathionyl-hydroquinone reductase